MTNRTEQLAALEAQKNDCFERLIKAQAEMDSLGYRAFRLLIEELQQKIAIRKSFFVVENGVSVPV